eukprot:CAMPEP_0202896334 /NCGR_PEP_ID=MMETSP1392-20130828/5356_1 /ASSEMBLY_ACC=CAM_ASM_000868 /TAXON_ID=225041 /ORGANISM="Chlamydomonas chlamydogama, Strain SAG 11-48b" /LENGTH=309 /DNA_ID=CAMNT_0049581661 /DNA_START=59 /DNA_END=988 /DNA_ORIENTATION=-
MNLQRQLHSQGASVSPRVSGWGSGQLHVQQCSHYANQCRSVSALFESSRLANTSRHSNYGGVLSARESLTLSRAIAEGSGASVADSSSVPVSEEQAATAAIKIGINCDVDLSAYALVRKVVASTQQASLGTEQQDVEVWATGWDQIYLSLKVLVRAQEIMASKGMALQVTPFEDDVADTAKAGQDKGRSRLRKVVWVVAPLEPQQDMSAGAAELADSAPRVGAHVLKGGMEALLGQLEAALQAQPCPHVTVELLGEKSVKHTTQALLKLFARSARDDELLVVPCSGTVTAAKQEQGRLPGLLLYIRRLV